ncbi:MAG: hypothetical protein M1455_02340 [Actinobacteria bacterium]|nr:hypothetical protein [Actinomycetota bacterium]
MNPFLAGRIFMGACALAILLPGFYWWPLSAAAAAAILVASLAYLVRADRASFERRGAALIYLLNTGMFRWRFYDLGSPGYTSALLRDADGLKNMTRMVGLQQVTAIGTGLAFLVYIYVYNAGNPFRAHVVPVAIISFLSIQALFSMIVYRWLKEAWKRQQKLDRMGFETPPAS